jgi:hypothetical protein
MSFLHSIGPMAIPAECRIGAQLGGRHPIKRSVHGADQVSIWPTYTNAANGRAQNFRLDHGAVITTTTDAVRKRRSNRDDENPNECDADPANHGFHCIHRADSF